MKKHITILIALFMAIAMIGCSAQPTAAPSTAPATSTTTSTESAPSETKTEEAAPEESGTFYAREHRAEILANIDAVIAKLNNGEIDYDAAIAELQTVIPKPESDPSYPSRDINVIIGWGEGGSSDKYPRNIGVDAAKILGVNMVYQNMAGSNGDIAVAYTLDSEPDGYTICGINGSQPSTQIFYDHDYVFTEDVAFITANQSYAEGLYVRADSGLKTWDDVVAYAKENGNINIGTVGETNDDGLVCWALQDHFGINMTNFGYAKGGERTTALMGGHVDLLADSIGTVTALIESGDVIPVLMYGSLKIPQAPDCPNFEDYGLDISLYRFRGFAGPGDMPEDIVEYLYQVYYAAQWLPYYQEFEKTQYLDLTQPFTLAPEELKAFCEAFYEEGMAMYEKYYKAK